MLTAVVTGANRGVGREITKQLVLKGYRVILTSRDAVIGSRAVDDLRHEIGPSMPGELIYHQLDVTHSESIQRLHDDVVSAYGAADILVNNAAMLLDQYGRVLQTPVDIFRLTMETNCFWPFAAVPDVYPARWWRAAMGEWLMSPQVPVRSKVWSTI